MATRGHRPVMQPSAEPAVIVRAVTVITGTVVGLTFLFGFGNVLNLALRLGVPVWVAPLVAPAVDLSILGLLLGTRHPALTGASPDVLRSGRRLLIFASVITLALNVADPLVIGKYGKAAFDAVGPLLLIGWAEVGPGFLQAIVAGYPSTAAQDIVGIEQPNVQAPEQSEASCLRRDVGGDQDKVSVREGLGCPPKAVRQRHSWIRLGGRTKRIAWLTRSRYRQKPCASGWA